jgi:hypothetical protein
MFSFVAPSGMVALLLPKGEREAFLGKYLTKLFDGCGLDQKEYVLVPEELLESTAELAPYFAMSYASCRTLKPKKTVGLGRNGSWAHSSTLTFLRSRGTRARL